MENGKNMVIDEQKKIKINMKEHISDNKKGKRLKGKKVKRKNGKKVIIVLALIILLSASYYIYIRFFEKKFKDVTIEFRRNFKIRKTKSGGI